jgi:hypothetical protein
MCVLGEQSQALAGSEHVLLALSQSDIGDTFIRPAVCTQYYALLPGTDSMSLLLRRVGCRDQLVSEASAASALPPTPSEENRLVISHALDGLASTSGSSFSPLQLATDVHGRIADLVLRASSVSCID